MVVAVGEREKAVSRDGRSLHAKRAGVCSINTKPFYLRLAFEILIYWFFNVNVHECDGHFGQQKGSCKEIPQR